MARGTVTHLSPGGSDCRGIAAHPADGSQAFGRARRLRKEPGRGFPHLPLGLGKNDIVAVEDAPDPMEPQLGVPEHARDLKLAGRGLAAERQTQLYK